MKKVIFILTLLALQQTYAQSSDKPFSLGAKVQIGELGLFGIEGEYLMKPNVKIINSVLLSANINSLKIKTDFGRVTGTGFEVGIGARKYILKENKSKGLFIDANVNYGAIKFDEKLKYGMVTFDAKGKYRYISLVNASIGYKFLYKNFVAEPSISGRYNVELKGEDFVDNKDIDNLLFNVGFKLAYQF